MIRMCQKVKCSVLFFLRETCSVFFKRKSSFLNFNNIRYYLMIFNYNIKSIVLKKISIEDLSLKFTYLNYL